MKTMKSLGLLPLLLLALGFLFLAGDFARSSPGDTWDDARISITIPAICVTDVQPLNLDFGEPSPGDFESGRTPTKKLTVSVKSNADWVLAVEGSGGEYWDGPWQKPVGDIQWHFEPGGGSAWNDLTTSPVEVTSGGPTGKWSKTVLVRVKLDWQKDIEGEYSYESMLFTASAP